MVDMYYRKQPLDVILGSTYRMMKMAYRWSKTIAEAEKNAVETNK